MPRGMTHCRVCGKPVPSCYRENHEKFSCLKMRFDRGDQDVVARVLAKTLPLPVKVQVKLVDKRQKRLFEVIGRVI